MAETAVDLAWKIGFWQGASVAGITLILGFWWGAWWRGAKEVMKRG